MIETYECTECDALTDVRIWPATRWNPADSTHGDGCCDCGGELYSVPIIDDEYCYCGAELDEDGECSRRLE